MIDADGNVVRKETPSPLEHGARAPRASRSAPAAQSQLRNGGTAKFEAETAGFQVGPERFAVAGVDDLAPVAMDGAAPDELSHAAVAQALERHLQENPQDRGQLQVVAAFQAGGRRMSPRYHYLPWVREGAAHALHEPGHARAGAREGRRRPQALDAAGRPARQRPRAGRRAAARLRPGRRRRDRPARPSCAPTRSRARPTSSRTTSPASSSTTPTSRGSSRPRRPARTGGCGRGSCWSSCGRATQAGAALEPRAAAAAARRARRPSCPT